ncbi:DUF2336 domain-containing protein [Coralliovum pocilloporae]|uniref:DUF2336 domain-containing protein n=1 Tax=Coralliovum pocilloporae TaxID=3066369 RepID=UPI0033078C23
MLEDYKRLAETKDPVARSRLIRQVSAAYADRSANNPSPVERELFSSIVLDLYDQLSDDVRMDIVVRLARTDRITPALAARLAREDIYMSELLLEHSPCLDDQTLLSIARDRDSACKQAIARRTALSAIVVDALISTDLKPVLLALLRNRGALFTQNAVLVSTIRAQGQDHLLFEIADRCLIDDGFSTQLCTLIESGCPFLSAAFKQAVLDGELGHYVEQLDRHTASTEISIGDETFSRHEAQVSIASGDLSFESVLQLLLNDDDRDGVVWFLSRHLNISPDGMSNLLMSRADASLSRMMSGTGVSEQFYKHFLMTRDRWLGRTRRSYMDDMRRFRQLVAEREKVDLDELPGQLTATG